MLGELPRSGIGTPADRDRVKSLAELSAGTLASNKQLIAELREDAHASELLRATREDAALGRMAAPAILLGEPPSDILLHPRFTVEQTREDGSLKFRAVDHLSWSSMEPGVMSARVLSKKKAMRAASVNGFTFPAEKMHHDTVDTLFDAMALHVGLLGEEPGLIKVCCLMHNCWAREGQSLLLQGDIDGAYRRVPVHVQDRWACGVAFKIGNEVWDVHCAAVRTHIAYRAAGVCEQALGMPIWGGGERAQLGTRGRWHLLHSAAVPQDCPPQIRG